MCPKSFSTTGACQCVLLWPSVLDLRTFYQALLSNKWGLSSSFRFDNWGSKLWRTLAKQVQLIHSATKSTQQSGLSSEKYEVNECLYIGVHTPVSSFFLIQGICWGICLKVYERTISEFGDHWEPRGGMIVHSRFIINNFNQFPLSSRP